MVVSITRIPSVSDLCPLFPWLQTQVLRGGYPSRAKLSSIGKRMLPPYQNSHPYTTQLKKGESHFQKTRKHLILFHWFSLYYLFMFEKSSMVGGTVKRIENSG